MTFLVAARARTSSAVDDVTDFWHDTYPEVYGEEFQDLAGFYP